MAIVFQYPTRGTLPAFLIAGLAGGMAEAIFIAGYSQLMPVELAHIAREITASFSRSLADGTSSQILGLAIHFLLSLLIGAGFYVTFSFWSAWRMAPSFRFAISLSVLLVIWYLNFYFLLPNVNPTFVTILPLTITFTSKVVFGLALWVTSEFIWANQENMRKELTGVGKQLEQAAAKVPTSMYSG